jgi:lysophospholipase L1-like esterase
VSTYEVLIRRWVDATAGNVPDASTPLANEAAPGSEPLYACRTPYDNGLHLGKIRPSMGGCQFEFAGRSVWNNVYQVLTCGNDASYGNPESPRWQGGSYGSVPADAAPVGYERSGAPLYLCRASYGGGRQLGKVRPGFWGCNFAMGGAATGTGVTVPTYEVLMGPEIKILPLGDSVTWGVGGTNAGYRAGLASLLSSAGRSFRFVGSSVDNPGQLPADQRHHEGHSGFVITAGTSGRQGISDNIATWLGAQGVHPDVVLLMIGTNDVDLNYDLGHAGDRLSALIGAIADKNTGLAPDARLIVAKLTPINDSAEDGRAYDYNTAVATAVLQHASRGENVRLVDMHGALTTSDLSDKLHPNDSGYAKMAHVWLDAIAAP